MSSPNILLIMTDEERYPPPYETDAVKKFRENQLTARESIRDGALEFHRHYAGSTACVASRATRFTGQYPSLHGVSQTDGTSKKVDDPAMIWLDPDSVPTLGDRSDDISEVMTQLTSILDGQRESKRFLTAHRNPS